VACPFIIEVIGDLLTHQVIFDARYEFYGSAES
jgi:hypothetical protein